MPWHSGCVGHRNLIVYRGFNLYLLTCQPGWTAVTHLALVSCALLASPDPSTLGGIVWDGGAIASREKPERGSWDSIKNKAEGFTLGRWLLQTTARYKLTQPMYDGQFKTVSLWSRGPNKQRWVEEVTRDYTAHFDEPSDGSILPETVRKRLGIGFGDYLYTTAASAALVIVPVVCAIQVSYNIPRNGISCHGGTYLIYATAQILGCLFWSWEAWLKRTYGEEWSEARTVARAISWGGQMLIGLVAILTATMGTLFQLLGLYRTCACKVSTLPPCSASSRQPVDAFCRAKYLLH
jgi:hypothetical protein